MSVLVGNLFGISLITVMYVIIVYAYLLNYILFDCLFDYFCLQCFDSVGWAAGRASGL